MFHVHSEQARTAYRLAVMALLLLSAASLLVTIWIMIDFLHEQQIVDGLIRRLPADATESARVLARELRVQFRLAILIVLNVIVTGFAMVLLWRAYNSSFDTFRNFKALAGDILSSMDQAVVTTDLNGHVTRINRRGIQLLSPHDDCLGALLSEFSDTIPLEEFRKEWMAVKTPGMTRDFKVSIRGNERTLRASCQILSNTENREIGCVLQVHDVTERVLIEERMLRMERYMGLGSVAVGLHHEIKNPLAALSLHVQLLEEELEESEPTSEVQEMLDVIQTEIRRVGSVLEVFRDFASLGRLNLGSVNIRELIDGLVRLLAPQASQKNVRIHVETDRLAESEVEADQGRLEQVLLNLLINAMDAMPNGGDLTIRAMTSGGMTRISVTDTGPGIPQDLHERLFDPYFTTKREGMGLGLPLCDKIMRQHQGSLDFQTSNHGTTFQMIWPVAQSSAEPDETYG